MVDLLQEQLEDVDRSTRKKEGELSRLVGDEGELSRLVGDTLGTPVRNNRSPVV